MKEKQVPQLQSTQYTVDPPYRGTEIEKKIKYSGTSDKGHSK